MHSALAFTDGDAWLILSANLERDLLLARKCAGQMCFFCVEGDTPFYLRKSTAFPRKMVADSVEADNAAMSSGPFNCDSPDLPPEPVSVWPKRKTGPIGS